jgi:hypothetical protein
MYSKGEISPMKKTMVSCLLLAVFCAGFFNVSHASQEGAASISRRLETPVRTKAELTAKTTEWMKRHLQLESFDPATGIIRAKGVIDYPSPPIDRIQYKIVFEMESRILDNANAVTLNNVLLRTPERYISSDASAGMDVIPACDEPVERRKDLKAVSDAAKQILDDLENYLR